jgi:hypothetical protein
LNYKGTSKTQWVANLNEEIFEKAYNQLRKIESETQIRIDPEETKKWPLWRAYACFAMFMMSLLLTVLLCMVWACC